MTQTLSDRGCLLRPARAKRRYKSEPSEQHRTSVAGSTVQFSTEQSLGSGHSPMPAPAGLGVGHCSSFLGTDLQCQARTFPVGWGEQRTRPFKDSRLPPRFPQSTSSTFNLHPQDRNQPSLHILQKADHCQRSHRALTTPPKMKEGHGTEAVGLPPCPNGPPLWFPGALVSGFMDHTV